MKNVTRIFATLISIILIFTCMPTVSAAATNNKTINITTDVGKSIKLKTKLSNPSWKVTAYGSCISWNKSKTTFKALASGTPVIKATKGNKTETYNITIRTNTKNSDKLFNKSLKDSTVWPIVKVNIYNSSDLKKKVSTINALTKCTVKETKPGDLFKISDGKKTGWLNAKYLMINLPDIRSDIKYNITNAYSSKFKIGGSQNKSQMKKYNSYQKKDTSYTSGSVNIKNLTGKKLYNYDNDSKPDGKKYNSKLKKQEFVCPVLYKFALKICRAQCIALQNGYSLKIYDGYRPQEVCNLFWTNTYKTVNSSKKANCLTSARVSGNGTCYTNGYTNLTCFVAKGVSDHARGYAIDVTMVYNSTGKEISTQSPIHDLSSNSVKWVNKGNKTGWGTGSTNILNTIMTSKAVGMEPLAYEWWHYSCPSLNVGYGNSNIKY